MSFNHPVSDIVAIIKNGYLADRTTIECPSSKIRENIVKILKDEGYILNYSKIKKDSKEFLNIVLKYHNSQPVVSYISVISKPGKRVYCNAKKIPLVKNGLGMSVISTSQGIISDHEARVKNLGGEILLKIF